MEASTHHPRRASATEVSKPNPLDAPVMSANLVIKALMHVLIHCLDVVKVSTEILCILIPIDIGAPGPAFRTWETT
jgi:hypothetical protein